MFGFWYVLIQFRSSSSGTDMLDILFVVLCVVLLTVIVMSTSYDFYLKRQNLPHMCNREHYKRPIGRGRKYLIHSLVWFLVDCEAAGIRFIPNRSHLVESIWCNFSFLRSVDWWTTSTSSLVINLIVAFWVIFTCFIPSILPTHTHSALPCAWQMSHFPLGHAVRP